MYTKLFGSIVHSTIWREADYVRLVWITMLALSDKKGCVWASVPGLADAARVSVEECRQAVERLSSPDPDSRTQVAEGRRIEAIDGGWWLINHAKFQAIKNIDERREQVRQAVQRHRSKKDDVINVISGNHEKSGNPPVSPSDQTRPTKTTTTARRKKRPEVTPALQAVIDHYLTLHPKRRPGPESYSTVASALALGYTAEELCEALDGNANDQWHKKEGKHELTYVLRNNEKIDDFRERHRVWLEGQNKPLLDPLGWMTPEFDEATRPANAR